MNSELSAFYYPWYGEDRHWGEGYVSTPKLGQYSSLDIKIIGKHIDMLKESKINTIILSWWGIQSYEDNAILNVLIPQLELSNINFYLLIENFHAKSTRGLAKDIAYLEKNYFHKKGYKKSSGKPLLFLYLSRIISTDVLDQKLRSMSKVKDIYFIGDEVYWFKPTLLQLPRFKMFNEISLYNPHISEDYILDDFWKNILDLYRTWQVFSSGNALKFTPTVIPGFDDSAVRPSIAHPKIKRDPIKFINLIQGLSDSDIQNINICSFNEWHENTQIEPSKVDDIISLLKRLQE